MSRSGQYDFFLTQPEKERFSQYNDAIEDNSLSTRVLSPFWEQAARLVPSTVAPNVLSLAGLLCTIQAFYLCYRYMETNRSLVTVTAALLVSLYQTLDALDGIQARVTANASPVGALWDHACDNVAIVFVSLVGCYVVGLADDLISLWYIVQFFSLGLLAVHLKALSSSGPLRFGLLSGPGEAIFVFEVLLLASAFLGPSVFSFDAVPWLRVLLRPRHLYYAMVVLVVARTLSLPARLSDTRRGLLFCLLFRVAPAVLFYLGWVQSESLLNVVCDGLFVSLLSTDVAVANMSGRNLHPWLLLFAMASVINYLAIVGMVMAYYVIIFVELTYYMKLPMFTLAVNVYVDGVYDLCHVGHHNIFSNALKFGNRLFVGVLSDDTVAAYKRKPVMTMEERAAVVATCKGVFKVITDAPCPGIPLEFLRKWNIHIVCHSPEYDKPDDKYYEVPRKLGMTRVLPRTEGISTSDLIRRVKAYGTESKQVF